MDLIKARFIGENGSMGFRTGKEYHIRSRLSAREMWIIAGNLSCPYSSLESFLQNWELIK